MKRRAELRMSADNTPKDADNLMAYAEWSATLARRWEADLDGVDVSARRLPSGHHVVTVATRSEFPVRIVVETDSISDASAHDLKAGVAGSVFSAQLKVPAQRVGHGHTRSKWLLGVIVNQRGSRTEYWLPDGTVSDENPLDEALRTLLEQGVTLERRGWPRRKVVIEPVI